MESCKIPPPRSGKIKYRHRICNLSVKDRADFILQILDRWPSAIIWRSLAANKPVSIVPIHDLASCSEYRLFLGLPELDPFSRFA